MCDSTTTVTVGLDVHARSIRLAAIRGDQLLEERTMPYDDDAVESVLRRWPAVRCCWRRGRRVLVCSATWSGVGSIVR